MELSLQDDVVENNDEIKVEGEILTWDTLWFEVCSSGEQNEDNKETVNTCSETASSETASSEQVVCSTEIKNDDASGNTLNIQNFGSKGNDVSAVTPKNASSQNPGHANDDAVTEVKRRTSTVRDESTGSSLITKALATNQDTSENDDTSASVLNKKDDKNIGSKDNVVGAVILKSASSQKPEHANDETTAEVIRRTSTARDEAIGSPLINKACATHEDTLGRTSKENDNTENKLISSKKSKGNKKVNKSNKKAQFKTSGVSIKYKQNVNKHDIKSTRKSERGKVEKMFNSTEWDTSTSHVKKKTQTIEKLTMTTESEDLEERTKENQKDTSKNLPCNELPDSQTRITDNTVNDLIGEIEMNVPYQSTEDQFNNLNSVTINNNESGQTNDHDDSENCTSSVIDTESNCQQVETSYDINDGSCQSAISEYDRKDSAKIISLNPQMKECNVVLKDIQNGRTDSVKIIIVNPQIKECNVVLKDTQYCRTDSAKTVNVNPQIKECYVVLKDVRKGTELPENTANNKSTVITNRRVVSACNDFNGDELEESLNSLRANDNGTKGEKVNKGVKSLGSRLEVNNQKQKGNICKGQKLNKLRNQKIRFPCGKEFKYTCNVCNKKFNKSCHFRKHSRIHTRVIAKTHKPKTTHWCFPCGKQFERISWLKVHQRIHSDERPYSCNVCNKKFKSSSHLKMHTLTHTRIRTKIQKQKTTHWCFPCGKEFDCMSRLKEHQKIHTEEMPYSCNVCCKTFKKLNYLKSHTRVHTSVRSNLQLQKTTHWCFPCGKEFKRMCRLREHQKSHSGERPYSCCLCSRKFKKLYYLKLHRRIHTGETPYKCEFCDKKFRYGSSLWLHKAIHKDITERKTFLCTFCGKSYFQKSNFEIHLLSHQTERRQSRKECQDSGKNVDAIRMNDQSIDSQSEFSDTNVLEENFKCSECYAMFEDKDTLKLHEQTHMNFKTFNCDVCADEFNLEKHLIKHLYIHMIQNNHNKAFKEDNQKNNTRNREKEQSQSGIGMLKVTSNKEYPPSKSLSHKWKFKCYKCNAGFNRMSKLKIHESSHAGLKIQHCDLCGQEFRNKSSLKHHNQIHTGENYFNCDQCDSSFKERSKLEAHKQKDHTGEKPFRCSVCCKRFREKTSLNKHIKHVCSQTKVLNGMKCNEEIQYESKNSIEQLPVSTSLWLNKEAMPKKKERFVCLHCGKGFHYIARFKRHLFTHSDVKPFPCDVCGKSFRRGHSLKIHRRIHTGENPYVCSFCEKAFSSISSLIFHRRTHTGEKPYLCHICGLQFSTGACLNNHQLMHQDIKLHKCQTCHKAYKRLRDLKKHIETHQKKDKLKCETCSKEFKNKDTLKSHMKIHTGIKPFSCLMCKKTFVLNQDLNQHKRTHTGEKPYKCDLCNKKFSVQKSLIDHLRVHSGEKPYACDICGKCRRTHLKTHTLSKEYACEQCGKEFTFKCNYEKHMITHTNERPFTCKVCNKGFTQSSSLNTHYRLHKKELNTRKHEEKDLILNESRSAESDKAKFIHEKVKVVNQTSTNLKNTGTPSMMDGRKMSTQKNVTDEEAAPKALKIKTTQKQITKFKGNNYPCSNCGKVFNQKCSLNLHQQTHYEKKQFKCDFCGKEFNFKGNLKTHLRVHTNEKPYKCHECGKGFSQSSSLHTHSRLHDK